MKIVCAIALLKIDNIKIYIIELITSWLEKFKLLKSENIKISIAGGRILKKIPAVTAAGAMSVRYVLIKLTDVP